MHPLLLLVLVELLVVLEVVHLVAIALLVALEVQVLQAKVMLAELALQALIQLVVAVELEVLEVTLLEVMAQKILLQGHQLFMQVVVADLTFQVEDSVDQALLVYQEVTVDIQQVHQV
jgi:hypothetical protein